MKKNKKSVDLPKQIQAAKALVSVHSLLSVGMFQHRHQDSLKQSLEFLSALHSQVLEECLSHPDADKYEDLVSYKKQLLAQAELNNSVQKAQE